ncbi:MAG: type II toxin-antitoxin system VapB family antitoxin [Prevotellaceae bacterium]|jgi:Arc/MetJ family transcription regulator|nr:type II toxin-antitoxin system VapB family antitoxin [Prevotellaceae bacterium]
MVTTVELDNRLMDKAMVISKMTTYNAVLNTALQEYIRANHRKSMLNYRGKGIWEGNLNEMRELR